jgi:predicted flap endonuclease-1-like 5' DNA nuclease
MKIRYVGAATVRAWQHDGAQYLWTPENLYTLEIADAELAGELLTHPPGDFVIAPDDALTALDGIGAQRAAELTLLGIATLEDAAALDDDDVARVELAMSVSAAQVRDWRAQALATLRRAEAEKGLAAAVSESNLFFANGENIDDAQASEEV